MKNPLEIDALYQTVPDFSKWASCVVNQDRWLRYTKRLEAFRGQSADLFERAREVVKRATAIDTGAIEGLYEVDRGFTITVAMETATWEARIGEKGETAKALIESQLRAYDYVIDFATQAVPIAEAWIRKLHEEICAGQETYRVMTEVGWQNQSLPRGQYKHHPNHVERTDGVIHPYAPVDQTPSEMRKLVEEIRSDAFQSAHPLLQAAYSHYGLVWIHPFADGNGRVARALASAFTYRAVSIPLMVLTDRKLAYLHSLARADAGSPQAFVDFILERVIDAVELVDDSFRAAGAPSAAIVLEELNHVYITKGGYTHDQVDDAGRRLMDAFHRELDIQIKEAPTPNQLAVDAGRMNAQYFPRGNFRGMSPNETLGVYLNLSTKYPAQAVQAVQYRLELPIDCDKDDCLVLRSLDEEQSLEVRMSDLVPDVSVAARLRVRMFAASAWANQLGAVLKDARKALGKDNPR